MSDAWHALYILTLCAYSHSRVTSLSRFGRKKSICKEFSYKLVVRGYFLAIKLRWNTMVDWIAWGGDERKVEVEKGRTERDGNRSDYTWPARIYRWVELRLRLARKWERSKKFSSRRSHRSTMNRESDRACHTNDVAVNCCLSMCNGRSQLP